MFSGVSIGETGLHLRCKGKLDSSRVEAGNSALISRLEGVKVAVLELWLASRSSTRVATDISANCLSCIKGVYVLSIFKWELAISVKALQGKGPHHALRGTFVVFSQIVDQSVGFLSSCVGDLREHLILTPQSHASFQGSRVMLGFLWSHCRGIGIHLELSR